MYWSYNKEVDQTDSKEPWYDVFLGGTCATSTWRQDVTIPLLTYVTPVHVLVVLLE